MPDETEKKKALGRRVGGPGETYGVPPEVMEGVKDALGRVAHGVMGSAAPVSMEELSRPELKRKQPK